MENSISLNDLIEKVQNGDYGDFDILLEMYRPMIDSAVFRYSGNIDPDDIRQICCIAFFNAVKSYDISSQVTFGYYAKVCVNNALNSEARRKNHNDDYDEYDKASEKDTAVGGPEDEIIMRESFKAILEEISEILTNYEFDVFRLYLMGYSYKEIAEKVGKNETSVGNALARIKNKIKNHRFGSS